ncbi:MAG TPA: PQQ-binding-like beta-propeller repeat protein [bacterium]|nr:PQQ-binding-like beta-propeller repeat protein [bacterium]
MRSFHWCLGLAGWAMMAGWAGFAWPAGADVADGLLVHLRLDNTVEDSSGNGIHGRAVKGPVFVPGLIGSHALRFDGVDDCVSLGRAGVLNFGESTDFSVSLWIKTEGWKEDPAILSNKAWKSGGNPGWGIFATGGGHWKANLADGRRRVDMDGGVIDDNHWHHIAVTFDRDGQMTLYQDGVSLGSRDIAGLGSIDTGLSTVIAQDGTLLYPRGFPGILDDIGIWRRVLSAQEAADIHAAGRAGLGFDSKAGLQASLPMPPDGATEIDPDIILRWRGGRNAVSYFIVIGTEEAAVREESSPKSQVTDWHYAPDLLELGKTYFWRIDSAAADGTVTRGEVWRFETKRNAAADWRFEPVDGMHGHIRDMSHGRSGVIQGSPRFVQNPSALMFDGRNRITIEPWSLQPLSSSRFTVEGWVYVDPGRARGLIAGSAPIQPEQPQSWRLKYDNFRFTFGLSTGPSEAVVHSQTGLITERWYHVAGTYDGNEARIYIDGELDARSRIPGVPDSAYADPAMIGAELGQEGAATDYFSGRIHRLRWFDRVLSEREVRAAYESQRNQFLLTGKLALGPYVQYTAADAAVIRWKTGKPAPSIVEYGRLSASENRVEDAALKTDHEIRLQGLSPRTKYSYLIKVREGDTTRTTPVYEMDTIFNYNLPAISGRPSPYPPDTTAEACAQLARDLLRESGVNQGYCLVLGTDHGQLVYELARQSNLYVHGVDTDAGRVDEARRQFLRAGLYGVRAQARKVESYSRLPFTNYLANLIICLPKKGAGLPDIPAQELARLLQPYGGVALLTDTGGKISTEIRQKELRDAGLSVKVLENASGDWIRVTRAPIPGSGEWTHQYGHPDNAASSYDNLQGATRTDELEVQWIGKPGPNAMVDRNPRPPAPLSTRGRLFTQGLNRIITQDAYNGTILWTAEIPALQRYNMPRDCGNWCADGDFLYTAVLNHAWRWDAASGNLTAVYEVPPPPEEEHGAYEWGYIARAGDYLYGSAVRSGNFYTNFWGGSDEAWADATSGPVTYKVCSDNLFAVNPGDGRLIWQYSQGVIINSTITIAEGRVFFVECRHPAVKASSSRQVGLSELWLNQYLVALDAETGRLEWERPVDTEDGIVVFYLLHSHDTLLIASSKTNYHLYGFSAKDGAPLWHASHAWISDNHGQHMQHPAVAGDTVYLRPCGYKVKNGTLVTKAMPPHEGGCATFAATPGALVYRGKQGSISMWDVKTGDVTNWFSIRPACWLSTIPAGGMVLSPEGGGGCSCGGWLETSISFIRTKGDTQINRPEKGG